MSTFNTASTGMASNLLKDLDSDFLALEQRGRTQRRPGDPIDTSKY